MSTGSPPDQSYVLYLFQAAVALLYALFGFTYYQIGQSKKDAIQTALDVRRELLATADIERQSLTIRIQEHRDDLEKIWGEIQQNRRVSSEQHAKMSDQINGVSERLAHLPTREEIKADAIERETRLTQIMTNVSPRKG